jgi:hypothetical protein
VQLVRRQEAWPRRAAAVGLTLLPALAAAGGDETLFVPTGNVVGIFWVFVAVFVVRTTTRIRALAIALAAFAAILPHLAPDAWMESWPGSYPRAAFMLGFVPPLGVAALVLWLARRRGPKA